LGGNELSIPKNEGSQTGLSKIVEVPQDTTAAHVIPGITISHSTSTTGSNGGGQRKNRNDKKNSLKNVPIPEKPSKESAEEEINHANEINYGRELEKSLNRAGKTEPLDQITDDGKVINHRRRAGKIKGYIEEDKANEPSPSVRSKKIPQKVWEGKNYEARKFLEEQYNGKCQLCDQTFIKRDGKPYFEGFYLVSRTNARWIDRAGNILCLCANHSAQLQHGSVEVNDIKEQINSFVIENKEEKNPPVLEIKLCGKKCKITYTEKHFLDLQGLLNTSKCQ
jgi:hypothetical protein